MFVILMWTICKLGIFFLFGATHRSAAKQAMLYLRDETFQRIKVMPNDAPLDNVAALSTLLAATSSSSRQKTENLSIYIVLLLLLLVMVVNIVDNIDVLMSMGVDEAVRRAATSLVVNRLARDDRLAAHVERTAHQAMFERVDDAFAARSSLFFALCTAKPELILE
jgi:hypothetical protein